MPTYEYACTSCGHHLEVVQSFHDEPLTECPVCGEPLRKVFGSIGIVLKGSGFYKNDSRSTSSSRSSGDSGSKTDGSKGDSPSTSGTSDGDTKPSGDKSGAGVPAASASGSSSSAPAGTSSAAS